MQTLRPLHLVLLLAAIGTLPACAGMKQRTAKAQAQKEEAVIIVRRDDPFAYRFDMTQRGKKMSADDFEAWMKARGLRIAKGGPASKGQKGKPPATKRKRD